MTFPVSLRTPGRDIPNRMALPYGIWTCADGREVLFNREYQPLWERRDGCSAQANPQEWVEFKDQKWFYDDFDSPWLNNRTVTRLAKVLEAFWESEDVSKFIRRGN